MSGDSAPAEIGMIWAQTHTGVIGDAGAMPWHLPEDLAHFKTTTRGAPVVMGRRTWESFPERYRPLPGRQNIVITSDQHAAEQIRERGGHPVASLDEGLELAAGFAPERIWVIGGGQVYSETVTRGIADLAVITVIQSSASGDTSAPTLTADWELTRRDPAVGTHQGANGLQYHFETHRRKPEMTETSRATATQPAGPNTSQAASQATSTNLTMLGLGGYLILPFLALFTVTLGFVLVLNDRILPGLAFLFVAQLWVAGGLWAHLKRRRLLQEIKEARGLAERPEAPGAGG
ncbi:dihydrofolate reductase [Nesterenkonia sp. E16_7]|uniref:dihydrofolate reductase n=1 Tax=unclassified Nesterenkonia TaxID=2629769 RepID=UPI001A921F13|nr:MULTISPECIES: dihydrofolate reductase [unclassified Nesterenkonia]MBO0594210.1 dihydrofolate reductase [Nesterenkonia sp. E16_10]MBO0597656.1 dihydrofolate reductase [Nesterenkonia sp. E16_7]